MAYIVMAQVMTSTPVTVEGDVMSTLMSGISADDVLVPSLARTSFIQAPELYRP